MTLHFRGLLDVSAVLTFRDIVFGALGERPRTLTLDLTMLTTVDSTGVSTLVTIARVARLVRIPLRLTPSPRLERLLTETGLDRLFTEAPPRASGEQIATRLLAA